jgi:hypothetical protein
MSTVHKIYLKLNAARFMNIRHKTSLKALKGGKMYYLNTYTYTQSGNK